jgi:hypothetical protein
MCSRSAVPLIVRKVGPSEQSISGEQRPIDCHRPWPLGHRHRDQQHVLDTSPATYTPGVEVTSVSASVTMPPFSSCRQPSARTDRILADCGKEKRVPVDVRAIPKQTMRSTLPSPSSAAIGVSMMEIARSISRPRISALTPTHPCTRPHGRPLIHHQRQTRALVPITKCR